MKKTILLLALLLGTSTISAQSIQCTGIALSTGVQCENKVALKHNRTKCHHHIDTDYTTQEDIDFGDGIDDTENSSDTYYWYNQDNPILEGLELLLMLFFTCIVPVAILFALGSLAQYIEDKYFFDSGWAFCGMVLLVCSLPVILPMIFN